MIGPARRGGSSAPGSRRARPSRRRGRPAGGHRRSRPRRRPRSGTALPAPSRGSRARRRRTTGALSAAFDRARRADFGTSGRGRCGSAWLGGRHDRLRPGSAGGLGRFRDGLGHGLRLRRHAACAAGFGRLGGLRWRRLRTPSAVARPSSRRRLRAGFSAASGVALGGASAGSAAARATAVAIGAGGAAASGPPGRAGRAPRRAAPSRRRRR